MSSAFQPQEAASIPGQREAGGGRWGVRVGLINYGRFPAEPHVIFLKAERLARLLIDGLDQESASIVATDKTVWLSKRPEDLS